MTRDDGRKRKKRRRGRALLITLLVLVLLVGGCVLAYFLMNLDTIIVVGNVRYTSEQIVALSGLKTGQHLLSLDKEGIAASIDETPDLVCEDVSVELPDTVTLTVRERQPAMAVQSGAAYLVIDTEGYILSITESDPGLVKVTGLPIVGMSIGLNISDEYDYRVTTMGEIYGLLETYGFTSEVEAIDLANINSIRLILKDGIAVKLGQTDELSEKLRWAISVDAELKAQGVTEGTIDVTTGGYASYYERRQEDMAATPTDLDYSEGDPTEPEPSN